MVDFEYEYRVPFSQSNFTLQNQLQAFAAYIGTTFLEVVYLDVY